MNRPKILVTGGEGFIGTQVRSLLRERGYVAVNYDICRGDDIRDEDKLRAAAGRCDAVIHLAGLTLVSESYAAPWLYYDVNGFGSLHLRRCVRADQPVILASTASIYGNGDALDESAPLRPDSPYAQSKDYMEKAFAGRARTTILRLFNVTGPGDYEPHILPMALKAVTLGQPFENRGTPSGSLRDYIHVTDVARAFIHAIEAQRKGWPDIDGAFSIGTGVGTSIDMMLREVEAACGTSIARVKGDVAPGQASELIAVPEKAQRVLRWRATVPLSQTVADAARGLVKRRSTRPLRKGSRRSTR